MFFLIKISSKNKETLKLFLNFLSKFENTNYNIIIKYFPKQKIKKFITILKSPHINKSAQEQFEYRIYTKKLLINSIQHLKFLYFLKKLQNNIFPFISLEIKGCYNANMQFKSILHQIQSNKLKADFFNANMFNKELRKKKSLTIITKYFNLLDCYGEYYMKNLINKKNNKHL